MNLQEIVLNEKTSPKVYMLSFIHFFKRQNFRNGEKISGFPGFGYLEWEVGKVGREVGVVIKEQEGSLW